MHSNVTSKNVSCFTIAGPPCTWTWLEFAYFGPKFAFLVGEYMLKLNILILKGRSLCDSAHFEPLSVQIRQAVSWSHGDGDVVASPGRPVIDGGSRGAGGVATQVARSSCVAEADTYA